MSGPRAEQEMGEIRVDEGESQAEDYGGPFMRKGEGKNKSNTIKGCKPVFYEESFAKVQKLSGFEESTQFSQS